MVVTAAVGVLSEREVGRDWERAFAPPAATTHPSNGRSGADHLCGKLMLGPVKRLLLNRCACYPISTERKTCVAGLACRPTSACRSRQSGQTACPTRVVEPGPNAHTPLTSAVTTYAGEGDLNPPVLRTQEPEYCAAAG